MTDEEKSRKVYKVFEAISEGYDDANTRISLGMEKAWKKQLIRLMSPCGSVLDVCCGTGDIAIALKKQNQSAEITGLDFSPAMLKEAAKKYPAGITWIEGNACSIPFDDNSFDGAAISFGLRNTPDYKAVLTEMKRVVKPEGIIACLDSFVPENAFIRLFYNVYFKGLMPHIGGQSKHNEEYKWLAESTELFLRENELKNLFLSVGLKDVKVKRMMCGACCLHSGIKPE